MARFEFRLPDIGEGIAEAEIVAWHVKVGDQIAEDQGVADMMTDKATVEMESPVSGTVIEVAGAAGDMVAIGSTLLVIETENDAADVAVPAAAPPTEAEVQPQHFIPPPHPKATEISVPQPSGQALASPAVRARAKDLGIDLSKITPQSGARLRHSDLDTYLTKNSASGAPVAAQPIAIAEGAAEAIKLIGLRRRIADNMAASKRHIPHFTYVEEIDVTRLEGLRGELNDMRGERPRLTVLPLIITAICKSLPEFPMINARFDDQAGEVSRYREVHLGIATQTEAGLMVPVIREAQALSIWQLSAEIARLAEAARTGKAKSEELSGSTLTVTSLGPLGGIATTPVINRPEVAIIGPNKIVERAVFVDGSDEVRRAKLMNLSISCDHRVVDGWDAASYVQAVKKRLEAPLSLLAE